MILYPELLHWVKERRKIYQRKEGGEIPPWTDDKILQQFKFTNVERELDRTTIWVAKNWRKPNKDCTVLWFNMVIACLLNWPDTLDEIGYTKKFIPEEFKAKLKARRDRGEKVFAAAYIVSTNGRAMDKIDYVVDIILTPMWEAREAFEVDKGKDTKLFLRDLFGLLTSFNGMGSFLASQVVAYMKYEQPWSSAIDWEYFATSGPGSRRGMNRLHDRPVKKSQKEEVWLAELHELQFKLSEDGIDIHAQDVQNCLCEFDKYMRTKSGEGRPKVRYDGNPNSNTR